jgi:hypothetical protein
MEVEQPHFSSQKARASVMLEIDRVEPSGLRWISQSVQRGFYCPFGRQAQPIGSINDRES